MSTISKTNSLSKPLFNCNLVHCLNDPEQLSTIQICLGSWLRGYVSLEENDGETFYNLKSMLYEYRLLDDLLGKLIKISFSDQKLSTADYDAALTGELFRHVNDTMLQQLEEQRELVRDGFLSCVPDRDETIDDCTFYDHALSFAYLNEFLSKAIYYCLKTDADNAMVSDPATVSPLHPSAKAA